MNEVAVVLFVELPLLWILYNISCFLIITLHELGHAIPSLLFTKKKVTIYIGSYDDDSSLGFHIGKLFFRVKPRFFYSAAGGACHHEPIGPVYQNIIVVLSGPFASAIISAILLKFIFMVNGYGFLKTFIVVFFISSILSLVFNLYPSRIRTRRIMYSDGHKLLAYLKGTKTIKLISLGYTFYNNKQFGEALKIFEKLNPNDIDSYNFPVIFQCYLQTFDFKGAERFSEKHKYMVTDLSSDADTLCNLGYMHSNLGHHDIAFDYYSKAIEWNNQHSFALCNRGFTYNLLEKYEGAIVDFEAVIMIEPDSSYAYANKAYSYMKLKLFDRALRDLEKAMALDDKNSYAHRNLGIYHLEHSEYEKALLQLIKARELDANTHMIDEYIDLVEKKISEPPLTQQLS